MNFPSEYSSYPNYTVMEFMLLDPIVTQRTEILLYPFTSFIAEVGGCLGLFIGFSFLCLYDELAKLMLNFYTSLCSLQ